MHIRLLHETWNTLRKPVTDKLYLKSFIEITTFAVICHVSIDRLQSNKHTILTTSIHLLRLFQQYFNYIVEVSFIGGGTRSTRRKPPTCLSHWQTLFHNVVSSTPRHQGGSELTTLEVMDTDCIGKYNYNTSTATMVPVICYIMIIRLYGHVGIYNFN
jgi:hypothetical protein